MKRSNLLVLLLALILSAVTTGVLTHFKFGSFTYFQATYPGKVVKFYSVDAFVLWVISSALFILLGLAFLYLKRISKRQSH